jgi:phosphotransferase system enzyme I (PtsP)
MRRPTRGRPSNDGAPAALFRSILRVRNPTETEADASSEEMLTTASNRSVLVHERADRSLDGIFRLIEAAGQPRPLAEVLGRMCADVAAIAAADVVSVYVRDPDGVEDGQVFTMRGNIGFPAESVGRVRLRQGEGITGFVAEKLLPVSVAVADRDEHFKYIPGLGEERFPAMLAVPVVRGGAAAAVLVLQRGPDHEFTSEEVVLATALAAVISHALERAEERERAAREASRASVRLSGTARSGGAAMGRAALLPTLAALARSEPPAASAPAVGVEAALERLEADVRKLAASASGPAAREIASLTLILDDRRFRERLVSAAAGAAPLKSMSDLAREYARVAFAAAAGDEATQATMTERAAEIEDLCVIVHAATSGQTLVRPGDIFVTERLRVLSAAHALARGVSAIVADGPLAEDGAVAALARAAGAPLVVGVTGVFAWVRPGDLLVVDADAGSVRVNPEATQVARFRNQRA